MLYLLITLAAAVAAHSVTRAFDQPAGGNGAGNVEHVIPCLLGWQCSQETFLALFDDKAEIEDVFEGRVQGGKKALLEFRTAFANRISSSTPAGPKLLRTTQDSAQYRAAVEQVVHLGSGFAADSCTRKTVADTSASLLFTTVGEWAPDGRLLKVRLYYSSFPIEGAYRTRPPVLKANASAMAAGTVHAYQQQLKAGNASGLAALFEVDGYFREPPGAYHTSQQAILDYFNFGFTLGHGGGIDLDHTVVTTDGRAYVIEYNCVGWGGVALIPTAGAAVYELGRNGGIMSARVNDNVVPPPPDLI